MQLTWSPHCVTRKTHVCRQRHSKATLAWVGEPIPISPVEMLDAAREVDVTLLLPGTLQKQKGCSKNNEEELHSRAALPQEEVRHRRVISY